jgi:hypothetical protein
MDADAEEEHSNCGLKIFSDKILDKHPSDQNPGDRNSSYNLTFVYSICDVH